MIIDAHTHIGFGGAITAKPEDLLHSMDRSQIDKALVFAGAMNACSTEQLLKAIKPHRDRLVAIGSVSPLQGHDGAERSLICEGLESGDIAGLKFYPGYEHYFPYESAVRPYLEWLQRYDKPAIFHSGDCYDKVPGAKLKYAHPLHIDELAVEMPDLKIVIAHLGYPWQNDAAQVCYKNKNVYADLSGFVYGDFDDAHRNHFRQVVRQFRQVCYDPSKILFGSDWPISDQASYVNVTRLLDEHVPAEFFAENAQRVFGLK